MLTSRGYASSPPHRFQVGAPSAARGTAQHRDGLLGGAERTDSAMTPALTGIDLPGHLRRPVGERWSAEEMPTRCSVLSCRRATPSPAPRNSAISSGKSRIPAKRKPTEGGVITLCPRRRDVPSTTLMNRLGGSQSRAERSCWFSEAWRSCRFKAEVRPTNATGTGSAVAAAGVTGGLYATIRSSIRQHVRGRARGLSAV
jgi:hypothetical protein